MSRGSISTENSASGATSNAPRIAAASPAMSSGVRMVGEPPPQWMWRTLTPAGTRAATRAISVFSVTRYSATGA